MGIGAGDEVIVPSFNLIVAANAVILTGARPVLVDVDARTWCLDPALVEEKITPRTRAIIAVHIYGHPCDMDAIMAVAARHGLRVIEDGAEAHGAEYKGRRVGAIGDAGCFSFYGNKIITTGEGGMVVTDDRALAAQMRLLRNQAFEEPRFVHRFVGFNYRLTNIQAAIGLAQVERIDERVAHKRAMAGWYSRLLAGAAGVTLPAEEPWAKNVYWMYGIVLDEAFGPNRDETMRALAAHGVETRAFFHPMHQQPVFRDGADPRFPDVRGAYPVSERLGRCGLYLPSGSAITEDDARHVVAALHASRVAAHRA
jgi:perosamine synthetase